jgi:hypothetical protein
MTTANMAETKRMKRSVSQANRVQVYGRDFLHPQRICPLSAGEMKVEHAGVERHLRRNEPNFIQTTHFECKCSFFFNDQQKTIICTIN